MKYRVIHVSNIILFLSLFFSLFNKTTLAQDSFSKIEQLAKSSDLIIIGQVEERQSFWNENKTRIFTEVKIHTEEFIKGNSSDSRVTVKVPGGEIGEIGEIYSHMPKFSEEEEVILFIKKDAKNNYRVTGGEEGKIRVIRDKNTGRKMTSNSQNVNELKNNIKQIITE